MSTADMWWSSWSDLLFARRAKGGVDAPSFPPDESQSDGMDEPRRCNLQSASTKLLSSIYPGVPSGTNEIVLGAQVMASLHELQNITILWKTTAGLSEV